MLKRCLTIAAILLAGTAAAVAAGPRLWTVSGAEGFTAGEALGVAIDGRGRVILAPEVETRADPGVPRVWAFVESPDGILFGSWGEQGRVHRVDRTGESRVVARLQGVAAQAMAWGPDDRLYVAAGPEAAVFRLDPDANDAEPEPWFEVGTRYVWAMAFDAAGNLWLGTGGDGRVIRVDPDGNGELIYDTPEPHVTALETTPAGEMLAGTEGSGYVYRLDRDGSVTVLFDAPQREITDLLWIDGVVLAAAFGAGEPAAEAGGNGNPSPGGRASGTDPTKASGAVYRIAADGLVQRVWVDEEEGPYALGLAPDGTPVVGTGPEGRLLALGEDTASLRAEFDAGQVVGLRRAGDRLLVATSNPGRVYALHAAARSEGSLISPVHDAGAHAAWGILRWSADLPAGTAVSMQTRSGNTGTPDDTWSGWAPVTAAGSDGRIASPAARFLQWRAVLSTTRGDGTPALRRVEAAFVVRNLPPRVVELTVHPGGVVYRQNAGFDDGMPFAQVPPAIARELESSPAAGSGSFLGRPYYVAGLRTFTWEAADDNDDPVRFDLSVRGELEREWKPIAHDLEERMFVLDTRRLPDGAYHVRLTATDADARPAGDGLSAHRESGVFVVDNTAPEWSEVTVGTPPDRTLRGRARDATSLIERLQYSVDGGPWHTVRPLDGVADADREELAVRLGELPVGEHTVIVRAIDTAQNVATSKVVFVVEATEEVENGDD